MALPTPIYSARDTAITQRPTSTAILAIDSEDRFNNYDAQRLAGLGSYNNSPYSFTINKNESMMNGFFTRLGVTEITFPWVIPNVNRRCNSIVVGYDISGGAIATATVTLAESFMTPSQIADALQTQIRALNPALTAFTMTYGVQTSGSMTQNLPVFEYKTNDANVQISFAPIPPTGYPYDYARTKQLFDLLGFTAEQTSLALNGMGGTTYCQSIRYVDVVCSMLVNNQGLHDTMSQEVARDVLCRVYVSGAPGEQSTVSPSASTFCPPGCAPTTIYRDFSNPKQIQWLPNQPIPGTLKFDVYDDAGVSLTVFDTYSYPSAAYSPPGPSPSAPTTRYVFNRTNWSMTLLVTEN